MRLWKVAADGSAYGFVCQTVGTSDDDRSHACGKQQLSCWLKADPNRKLSKNPFAFDEASATKNGTMAAQKPPPAKPPPPGKAGALSPQALTDAARSNAADIGLIKQLLNAVAAKTGALDNTVGKLQDENGASQINWPVIGLGAAAVAVAVYLWKS